MGRKPIGPEDYARLQVAVNAANIVAAAQAALRSLREGAAWQRAWTAPSEGAATALAETVREGLLEVLRAQGPHGVCLLVGTMYRPTARQTDQWRVYVGFRPAQAVA